MIEKRSARQKWKQKQSSDTGDGLLPAASEIRDHSILVHDLTRFSAK